MGLIYLLLHPLTEHTVHIITATYFGFHNAQSPRCTEDWSPPYTAHINDRPTASLGLSLETCSEIHALFGNPKNSLMCHNPQPDLSNSCLPLNLPPTSILSYIALRLPWRYSSKTVNALLCISPFTPHVTGQLFILKIFRYFSDPASQYNLSF